MSVERLLETAAQIIGVIRDVVLIVIFLLAMVVLLALFSKVSAVLDSLKRTVKAVQEVSDALSDKIVGPATAGSGIAYRTGKLAAFFFGLSRRSRRKGGTDNGE